MTIGKLGKLAVKHDARTLDMARYLKAPGIGTRGLPAVPLAADFESEVKAWGMMANDVARDCTIATIGHQVLAWTTYAGTPWTISDADILTAYTALTGYDPETGDNDTGCHVLDVLNYWRTTGVGGHKIFAFVKFNARNWEQVADAIYLFGSAYLGVQLPKTARKQIGGVWDLTPAGTRGAGKPGSWGGHAVPATSYSPGRVHVITWGEKQVATSRWLAAYADEAYAVLSPDWVTTARVSPDHFDLETLTADLALL